MSWSIRTIGRIENVSARLTEYGETLAGKDKAEYAAALPLIIGLVGQNYGKVDGAVEVKAEGSASYQGDEQLSGACAVSIKPIVDA